MPILSVSHRQALPLPLLLVTIASASSAGPTSPGDLKKPHNRFDDNLAQQGRAPLPGQVAKLFKPTETQVIRIVLTGGPCAGKSSSLVQLTEAAKRDGFDVYAAPETATLVFNSGVEWPSPDDPRFHDKVLIFQKALFKLQLQLERSMTNMAACTGRPSIIVFDRGLLDGKAYMTSEGWQALLDGVAHEGRDVVLLGSEISEDYILSRYDGVVHLVTAADGAVGFYKSGRTHDNLGNCSPRTGLKPCRAPPCMRVSPCSMTACWLGAHVRQMCFEKRRPRRPWISTRGYRAAGRHTRAMWSW